MQVNRTIAIFGTALLITAVLTQLYVSVFQNNILVLMLFFVVGGLLTAVVAIRALSSTTTQSKTSKEKHTRHKSDSNKQPKREIGRIKFFNIVKQYGFITREGASDLYVQQRSLGPGVRPQHLTTGQVVTFEVVDVRGQKVARDVCIHKRKV